MTTEDFGRVALGAPALQQVVIVSLPDCLLVRGWSRSREADNEASATHLGEAFRSAQQALRSVGVNSGLDCVTVETPDSVMVVTAVGADAAAGFMFDRTAPLGLIRIQVRQLAEHLQSILPPTRDPRDLTEDLAVSSRPEPTAPPTTIGMSPPTTTPRPAPLPSRPPERPSAPAGATPGPTESSPAVPVAVAAALSSEMPAVRRDDLRPRAVRLMEFFRRYAPDPHASMLRLSLRTGISLEQLDRPASLTEAQVETVSASVRDILGRENVGV